MSVIYLLDHIALSLYEIVTSDQKYSIHNFSNFCGRTDLKLFLCCGSLCNIRTERHVETEIFIEIKWCHSDRLADSIVISKFNY